MPYPQYPQYGYPQQPMFGFNQPQYQQPQPQPQKPNFDFVNGVEGAKSYMVQPGHVAFLFDNENSACYIKSANGMGQATIEYFKVVKCSENEIRPAPAQPAPYATAEQVSAIDARLKAIEESLRPKEEK